MFYVFSLSKSIFFFKSFSQFIKNVFPNVRKTQLNILPYVVYGMISSESSVASDISKHLKHEFSLIQFDSVVKRIRRFYNNPLFKPYDFYVKVGLTLFQLAIHSSRYIRIPFRFILYDV